MESQVSAGGAADLLSCSAPAAVLPTAARSFEAPPSSIESIWEVTVHLTASGASPRTSGDCPCLPAAVPLARARARALVVSVPVPVPVSVSVSLPLPASASLALALSHIAMRAALRGQNGSPTAFPAVITSTFSTTAIFLRLHRTRQMLPP